MAGPCRACDRRRRPSREPSRGGGCWCPSGRAAGRWRSRSRLLGLVVAGAVAGAVERPVVALTAGDVVVGDRVEGPARAAFRVAGEVVTALGFAVGARALEVFVVP